MLCTFPQFQGAPLITHCEIAEIQGGSDDSLETKMCLPDLEELPHMYSRLFEISQPYLDTTRYCESATLPLDTASTISQPARVSYYIRQSDFFSGLFYHTTMGRSDYVNYFRNLEYHPEVLLDVRNSKQINSQLEKKIIFSKRQEYELAMQVVETNLMTQDSSIRVLA